MWVLCGIGNCIPGGVSVWYGMCLKNDACLWKQFLLLYWISTTNEAPEDINEALEDPKVGIIFKMGMLHIYIFKIHILHQAHTREQEAVFSPS